MARACWEAGVSVPQKTNGGACMFPWCVMYAMCGMETDGQLKEKLKGVAYLVRGIVVGRGCAWAPDRAPRCTTGSRPATACTHSTHIPTHIPHTEEADNTSAQLSGGLLPKRVQARARANGPGGESAQVCR